MSEPTSASHSLLSNYSKILAEVKTAAVLNNREPSSIQLVAVSKVHPYEKIKILYEKGQRDFGENYVQELLDKSALAKADGLGEIRWHFIGHLQTNKVKALLPHVFMIHGVGSFKLAQEISKRSNGLQISALVEVNLDSEESKSGVQISELRELVEASKSLPGIKIQGLMCIPNPERQGGPGEAFRQLGSLAAELGLSELSMGMTADFPEAIAHGATLIRVGSAIFGERSPREKL
jgi:PLP dependent protein